MLQEEHIRQKVPCSIMTVLLHATMRERENDSKDNSLEHCLVVGQIWGVKLVISMSSSIKDGFCVTEEDVRGTPVPGSQGVKGVNGVGDWGG